MVASPPRIVVVSAYGARTARTSVSSSGRRYSPSIRSGAFSNGEPRSSTKSVRVGAGRARRARIQPASARAACVVSGGAADGAAPHGIAVSASSHASLRANLPWVIRGRSVLSGGLGPEIVEIEPVIGRAAGVMLQARGVPRRELAQHRDAILPRDPDRAAERLEHQVVAVA